MNYQRNKNISNNALVLRNSRLDNFFTLLVIFYLLCNPLACLATESLLQLGTTQFEELLVPTKVTTPLENSDLLHAIEKYRQRTTDDDFTALTNYVDQHSTSGWNMALLTNLGLNYYRTGRFSAAIEAYTRAWNTGKDIKEQHAKALVDRALGELMRMHARVGHVTELDSLFKDMGKRPITGPATELVTTSREGLWMMRNKPGISFLCGPMALKNLLLVHGAKEQVVESINNYQSSPQGVSLSEVDALAKRVKLDHKIIYRQVGRAIPVPSIIHWKVSHYAAIVEESHGRYHIKDPTFGNDLWVSKAAIDAEASGYFLINNKTLSPGWRQVSLTEAGQIHGMGNTGNNAQDSATKSTDLKAKPGECSRGMCNYNITEMLVSLNLNDTPVGYAPPKGHAVYIKLTYNQRESDKQPANPGWFNVGTKWTLNWLSYIQDSPTVPGDNVLRYVAGGGYVNYSGYNSTTGQFTPETDDGSILVQTSVNPIAYERRLADGSKEVYSESNGATVTPRRVFLKQLVDPQVMQLTSPTMPACV